MEQLADIGISSYFLSKVNCKTNPEICADEKITSFPTWKNSITKQVHVGRIPITELASTLSLADEIKTASVNVK